MGVWHVISIFTNPLFFPSIARTVTETFKLLTEGPLITYFIATISRIVTGWMIGAAAGILVGWMIGFSKITRRIIEPYINFFRGLPPIVWVSLFVIWFGYGEIPRIMLVAYGSFFVVVVSTIDAVLRVEQDRVRAAQCLGASDWGVDIHVKIPSSVPGVFTGARVALGVACMTIVAVEMLIASSGLGYMIWVSRLYIRPEWVFAGIIFLGVLTFGLDFIFKNLGGRVLRKYGAVK